MEGIRVIFFSEGNFGGSMYIYTADNSNITGVFPNGVGSAKVEGSGVVTLYQLSDYRGVKALLLPGEYKDIYRFPVESQFVGSVRITKHNPETDAHVTFFSQINFGGYMYIYTADNSNIKGVFLNGVGSAKVEGGGVVTLCQMIDYKGAKALLLPGEYKDQSRFPVESEFVGSVRITKHNPETENVRVTFFSQGNFGGYMYIYTADNANITEDFPNGVGSAKVAGKPPGGAVTLYQMRDYKGEKALLLIGEYKDQSCFPYGSAFVKSVRIGLY